MLPPAPSSSASPSGDLSSTEYVLANPGNEYLVLQPSDGGEPFTVAVSPGTYAVQWYDVNTRETTESGELTVETSTTSPFRSPFKGAPAVLYLNSRTR